MDKCKFWLIQLVMMAFVSLVFGSPVMAHSDRGHGWSKKWSKHKDYSNEKKDARYHKKIDRKMDRLNNRLDRLQSRSASKASSKRRHNRHDRKIGMYQKMYDRYEAKLTAHDAKYHVSVPLEEEVNTCPAGTVPDATAPSGCSCSDPWGAGC
jgi:hypothetical protein